MLLPSTIMFSLLINAVFCLATIQQSVLALPSDVQERDVAGQLEVIQVERPLRGGWDGAVCMQSIVQNNFAASYGTPFVGLYTPPPNCTFTTTIFNLTITSNGTNYDRLALLFLNNTEIWRFSTAMPTRSGIYSSFQKDMSIYHSLLLTPQTVILSLDNIFDSVFTGAFNVTITALYYLDTYSSSESGLNSSTFEPASQILPISTYSAAENTSSVFSLPDDNATVSLTFPRNAKAAVVSIMASGNGNEEFWYRKGVPTSYVNTFNNSQLHGFSPFREIQLLIDGILTGVSWPFPIVYTGGINPGLWRPIVGIDVYDIPTFEIDVSPWLGVLCDGNPHSFELKAVGYDSGGSLGTVGENWWVTGAVFVWVDEGNQTTTGSAPIIDTPPPQFTLDPQLTTTISNTSAITNTSLWISLQAQRNLTITANITTSSGLETKIWSQDLTYINIQNLTAAGYDNALSQLTTGNSVFSGGSNKFTYPIETYTVSIPANSADTNLSYLLGSIDRSLITTGSSILPLLTGTNTKAETLSTRQNGSCIYYWNNTYYEQAGAIDPQAGSIGATDQWYSYAGEDIEYGRIVKALDGLDDYEGIASDEVFNHTIAVPQTVKVPGEDL